MIETQNAQHYRLFKEKVTTYRIISLLLMPLTYSGVVIGRYLKPKQKGKKI